MFPSVRLFALAGALFAAQLAPSFAATIVALTDDGRLVTFDTEKRVAGKPVAIAGMSGRIIGIDVRPIDKKLYGVTDKGTIFTVDPATGATTPMSVLARPFDGGGRAAIDFNPQADRMRMIGANGTSFRVNVVTGEVAVDGSLRYEGKDANAGKKPRVTAVAYTNAMPNAKGTEMFDLDTGNGVFALQSPPNDGIMQTRGKLGTAFGDQAAFDILLDQKQDNVAYVVDKATLYTLDLDNGATKALGAISGLPAIIDIAVLPVQ